MRGGCGGHCPAPPGSPRMGPAGFELASSSAFLCCGNSRGIWGVRSSHPSSYGSPCCGGCGKGQWSSPSSGLSHTGWLITGSPRALQDKNTEKSKGPSGFNLTRCIWSDRVGKERRFMGLVPPVCFSLYQFPFKDVLAPASPHSKLHAHPPPPPTMSVVRHKCTRANDSSCKDLGVSQPRHHKVPSGH